MSAPSTLLHGLPPESMGARLVAAAAVGDTEIAREILAKCPVFDEPGENAWNSPDRKAFFVAAQEGHAEIVRLLCERVKIKDEGDFHVGGLGIALFVAAMRGHADCVRLVLSVVPGQRPDRKWLPQSLDFLGAAAGAGHAECVKLLLPWCDPRSLRNSEGMTALMLAAWRGHAECVKILIPESDLSQVDDQGRPVLSVAAESGSAADSRAEVIRLLLPWCDARRASLRDRSTPLMDAIDMGDIEAARVLLPASDPGARTLTGGTALIHAAESGNADAIRLLIPVSDLNARDDQGRNALQAAALNGAAECARALLPGSDAKTPDRWGRAAFQLAVSDGARYEGTPACADVLAAFATPEELEAALNEFGPKKMPHAAALRESRILGAEMIAKKGRQEKPESDEPQAAPNDRGSGRVSDGVEPTGSGEKEGIDSDFGEKRTDRQAGRKPRAL